MIEKEELALAGQLKECVANRNKIGALRCLKARKRKQVEILRLTANMDSIDELKTRIEQQFENNITVQAVNDVAKIMKNSVGDHSQAIGEVEESLDTLEDHSDQLSEINDTIKSFHALTFQNASIDETEIEDELDQLFNGKMEVEDSKPPVVVSTNVSLKDSRLPEVATSDLSNNNNNGRHEKARLLSSKSN